MSRPLGLGSVLEVVFLNTLKVSKKKASKRGKKGEAVGGRPARNPGVLPRAKSKTRRYRPPKAGRPQAARKGEQGEPLSMRARKPGPSRRRPSLVAPRGSLTPPFGKRSQAAQTPASTMVAHRPQSAAKGRGRAGGVSPSACTD